MTTVIVVGVLIALAVLAVSGLLFLGSKLPPTYVGLSLTDLQRHLSFCCQRLAPGSSAEIHPNGLIDRLRVQRRAPHGKTPELGVRVRSAHHPRSVLAEIAVELGRREINHRIRYTPKRKYPKELWFYYPADDPLTPSALAHMIRWILQFLEPGFDETFTVSYFGPWLPVSMPTNEDARSLPTESLLNRSPAYHRGYRLGRFVRSILRPFR